MTQIPSKRQMKTCGKRVGIQMLSPDPPTLDLSDQGSSGLQLGVARAPPRRLGDHPDGNASSPGPLHFSSWAVDNQIPLTRCKEIKTQAAGCLGCWRHLRHLQLWGTVFHAGGSSPTSYDHICCFLQPTLKLTKQTPASGLLSSVC